MISIVIPYIGDEASKAIMAKIEKNIKETTSEAFEIIPVEDSGFASLAQTYNHGFKCASGDVLVNMHNDVELPQDWDVPLSSAARAGFIGCVFVDESESDCESRGIEKAGNKYIPSCCFSVSRETWNKLGGYDEQFLGFHWEDTDLFLRAAAIGRGPARCDVTVKHNRAVTRSQVAFEVDEAYMANNFKRYRDKHKALFDMTGKVQILTLPDKANYFCKEEVTL